MDPRYSVERLLLSVYNVQTKRVIRDWLAKRNAASPSIGLEYNRGCFRVRNIY